MVGMRIVIRCERCGRVTSPEPADPAKAFQDVILGRSKETAEELRTKAQAYGWHHSVCTGNDYCPQCSLALVASGGGR